MAVLPANKVRAMGNVPSHVGGLQAVSRRALPVRTISCSFQGTQQSIPGCHPQTSAEQVPVSNGQYEELSKTVASCGKQSYLVNVVGPIEMTIRSAAVSRKFAIMSVNAIDVAAVQFIRTLAATRFMFQD
jgi:hypothetical protein